MNKFIKSKVFAAQVKLMYSFRLTFNILDFQEEIKYSFHLNRLQMIFEFIVKRLSHFNFVSFCIVGTVGNSVHNIALPALREILHIYICVRDETVINNGTVYNSVLRIFTRNYLLERIVT